MIMFLYFFTTFSFCLGKFGALTGEKEMLFKVNRQLKTLGLTISHFWILRLQVAVSVEVLLDGALVLL